MHLKQQAELEIAIGIQKSRFEEDSYRVMHMGILRDSFLAHILQVIYAHVTCRSGYVMYHSASSLGNRQDLSVLWHLLCCTCRALITTE